MPSPKKSQAMEIAGVFFFLCGILLSISLLTYDATDSSFSTMNTNPAVQNLIGKAGAFSSDICFQIMGISAYFLPILLIVLGISFLQQEVSKASHARSKTGWIILLVLLSAWAELLFASSDAPNFKGGTIGFSVNHFLIEYFALTGTYLVLFFFSIFGVMLISSFSPANILGHLSPGALTLFHQIKTPIQNKWRRNKVIQKEADHSPIEPPPVHKDDEAEPPEEDTEDDTLPPEGDDPEYTEEYADLVEDFPIEDDKETDEAPSVAEDLEYEDVPPEQDLKDPPPDADEPSKEAVSNIKLLDFKETKKTSVPNKNGVGHVHYQIPPLSLLSDPPVYVKKVSPEELSAQAQILKRKLSDFGVLGEVKEIHPGPVVTLFEFEPAPGVKLNKITALADDLALAMRALQVRIVPRIPGKSVVGIEIPNRIREEVFLKEILVSASFANLPSKLRLSLGKDIFGTPIAADLSAMPHLLIAGSTGSGKSVGLNSMILSILMSTKPTEVKMLLIDPKMIELSLYEEIPHLIAPVITDPKVASSALRRMVMEMQRRYELLAEMGVRNISAYNNLFVNGVTPTRPAKTQLLFEQMVAQDNPGPAIALPPLVPLAHIIVCIDELADLMVVAPRDVEESIGRLAQMARAAGIHLILATQRPSVDVLTGVIKANFPARIAFAVTSKTDSRTILDTNGADQLLGKGDMLYMAAGTSKITRIHGAYVSEEEVKRIVTFLKEQAKPQYENIFSTTFSKESSVQEESGLDVRDELYEKARELVIISGQTSASYIQRKMRVGYPRAARMIELMEEDGVVGPATGSKPRELLMKRNPDVHTHDAFTGS
jgi:S-DNA-T family DNA segregation ATPase FtsK/SpoIIIE